jgi:hypothetical protein
LSHPFAIVLLIHDEKSSGFWDFRAPLVWKEPVQVVFVGAVLEAVDECEAGNSPPDTGGVDATSRRSREASFNGADGVVDN